MKAENHNPEIALKENPTLIRLVEDLLSEDFSKKNLFKQQSLEEIKDCVLEAGDQVISDPSFIRTKESLILILQELELCGLETIPSRPVNVLFDLKEKIQPETPKAVNDFYSLYLHFKSDSSLPFSEEIKNKLLGQQLSLSLGNLAQKALHPFLSAWWPTRESSISLVQDPEKEDLHLHYDLATALNRLAILHQEVLKDPTFPLQTVENSLRYILSLSNVEEFVPAPIEAGYLLLFFGQQEFLERFLHNSLNVVGVEADEIMDFGFRMIRTQRLKSKAFSQNLDFTKEDLEMLEEDHEVMVQFLSKLRSSEAEINSEAA